MTDTKQPEALRLADQYRSRGGADMPHFDHIEWASQAEHVLRSQAARIAELDAQLAAIGAGGVTGLRKTEHFVRFERAKGTTTDEMRDNLSGELYGCGDTILVWANEGDIIMFGAAIAQEGGKP